MTDGTTTLSTRALHRLQVEAAFARGKPIECRWADRSTNADDWEPAPNPRWNWHDFDFRIASSAMPKHTAAEICTEIEKLVAELRSVTE